MVLLIGKAIQKWPNYKCFNNYCFSKPLDAHLRLKCFLTSHLRLQFWILYYKVLRENEKCLTTNDHMKSLQAAKIREIQTLYCNGLDLERPLMLSLSPCTDKHKQEVIGCINDFAKTFSSSFSQPSLCRYSIRFFFSMSNESSILMSS